MTDKRKEYISDTEKTKMTSFLIVDRILSGPCSNDRIGGTLRHFRGYLQTQNSSPTSVWCSQPSPSASFIAHAADDDAVTRPVATPDYGRRRAKMCAAR